MSDLERAGRNIRSARRTLDVAMRVAKHAAIAAHSGGTPETVIAEHLGVNRLTVRKWLGK